VLFCFARQKTELVVFSRFNTAKYPISALGCVSKKVGNNGWALFGGNWSAVVFRGRGLAGKFWKSILKLESNVCQIA
jgi:hypothetical protein